MTGRKDDQGKVRLDLLSPDAMEQIAHVLTFGADKYGVDNWAQGLSYRRVFAALLRHLWAWWRRQEADEETGLSHLAHAGCCLMFLIHYETSATDYSRYDDRPHASPKGTIENPVTQDDLPWKVPATGSYWIKTNNINTPHEPLLLTGGSTIGDTHQ
jgi:hypothetical protein